MKEMGDKQRRAHALRYWNLRGFWLCCCLRLFFFSLLSSRVQHHNVAWLVLVCLEHFEWVLFFELWYSFMTHTWHTHAASMNSFSLSEKCEYLKYLSNTHENGVFVFKYEIRTEEQNGNQESWTMIWLVIFKLAKRVPAFQSHLNILFDFALYQLFSINLFILSLPRSAAAHTAFHLKILKLCGSIWLGLLLTQSHSYNVPMIKLIRINLHILQSTYVPPPFVFVSFRFKFPSAFQLYCKFKQIGVITLKYVSLISLRVFHFFLFSDWCKYRQIVR